MDDRILTVKNTTALKIVAIIMMFCHHFFYDSWILPGNEYYSIFKIGRFTLEMVLGDTGSICVAIFSLLTGFGMYYSFEKTCNIKSLVVRYTRFLMKFWIILFTLFIPIYLNIVGGCSLEILIKAMFGLENSINMFSWYVYFYPIALFLLYVWHKIMQSYCGKYEYILSLFLLMVSFVKTDIVVVDHIMLYMPIVIIGYVVAKSRLMEKALRHICVILTPTYQIITGALLVAVTCCFRYLISLITQWKIWNEIDSVYAVVIMFAVVLIVKNLSISDGWVLRIGKATTNMWFIHAIFFGTYAELTQKIVYYPKYSIVVVGLALGLVYVISYIYDSFFERILHL